MRTCQVGEEGVSAMEEAGRGEKPARMREEGRPAGAGARGNLKGGGRKKEKKRTEEGNLGGICESRKEKGRYVEKVEGERERKGGGKVRTLVALLRCKKKERWASLVWVT